MSIRNPFFVVALFAIAFALVVCPASAQVTTSSTTLTNQIGYNTTCFQVGSTTGMTAAGNLNQPTTVMMIDSEAMHVTSVPSSNTVCVLRATDGTQGWPHPASSTVWFGPPSYFPPAEPSGYCVPGNTGNLPQIVLATGDGWNCPAVGTNANKWVKSWVARTPEFTDGAVFLPASSCYPAVSGNSTGTNGYTTAGASLTPVAQASTSASGTNTHTYVCNLTLPTRLTSGRGVQVIDATFFYGVQTSNLGTQAATLASGTMNSSTVFSYIALPTAAASETPSTVTPVRADSGTLTITPVVASANVSTTTAGAFYTMKFTPAAPIAVNTDLQQLLLTVTLQGAATSATVTNSPGVLVHYRVSPL